MANENAGFIIAIGWFLTVVVWILIGIATFNWIDVDSFGSAIGWLIVWHIASSISHFILVALIAGLASLFE